MKERIDELIKALNISGREFSRSIGKSESFARTISGSIGSDVLVEIIRTYPDVNLSWLVIGEGEMFNKNTGEKTINSENIPPNILLDYLKEKDKIIGDLREKIGKLKQELESAQSGKRINTLDTGLGNVAEETVAYKKNKK